ncbi:MAG TPA: hypothetical protein VK449_05695 [Anaerolineales bacterium]|nr:hypothetical protein [Anaerolineales bacterium]
MSTLVLLVLVLAGLLLILAGLWLSRRGRTTASTVAAAGGPAEAQASATSEAVEDLVNQRLAAIPEFAGTRVDFGTAADGSLEIWIGDKRYTSVAEIEDPRIRQTVQDAVAAYNR